VNARVLHFIASMGGGGAERQLTYLANGLPARGWEVHVALLSGGVNLERLRESGAAVHQLQVAGNYDPRLLVAISRVIGRVRPALVQTWLPQMDIAAGLLSSIRGIPWILSERSSNQDYLSGSKRLLRTASARRAAAIVANSAAGECYWASRIPSSRRWVIENALCFPEIDAAPVADIAPYRRGTGTRLMVAAGRFDPGKNHVSLIQALAIVARQQDLTAMLCGEGPGEPEIRAAVAAAGLDGHVVLAGYRHDLWSLMKAADLFVSVSHFEGRVNSVMEAAACGLPLVLSDIPEHREMFADESAWFVDRNDPVAIARAITQVLTSSSEAASRAAKAKGIARHWTVEAMTARYHEVYSELALKH
jgi:glycosyltransferase involved in cell wall biosynthesis